MSFSKKSSRLRLCHMFTSRWFLTPTWTWFTYTNSRFWKASVWVLAVGGTERRHAPARGRARARSVGDCRYLNPYLVRLASSEQRGCVYWLEWVVRHRWRTVASRGTFPSSWETSASSTQSSPTSGNGSTPKCVRWKTRWQDSGLNSWIGRATFSRPLLGKVYRLGQRLGSAV